MPSSETLLWLNDRVGQEIHVELLVTRGRERRAFAVFTGDGILRYWSEGWYAVWEETHFDPTNLDGSIRRRTADELIIELADSAYLHLIRQGASPPASRPFGSHDNSVADEAAVQPVIAASPKRLSALPAIPSTASRG